MSRRPRIYFPVESLVGLGHFNRSGALARAMVQSGADVTIASSTLHDPDRFFKGARTEVLPPYVAIDPSGTPYAWDAHGGCTLTSQFQASALGRARIARHHALLEETKPTAVLSEFWPFDRLASDTEMLSLLQYPVLKTEHTIKIVSIRDVLDTEGGVTSDYFDKDARSQKDIRAAEIINDHFDAVLVHGDPNFIKLDDTFGQVAAIKKPIIYTGYVLSDPIHRQLDETDSPAPLLVSCGSGRDAHAMVFCFLAAWEKLLRQSASNPVIDYVTHRPVHIVCGPRYLDLAHHDTLEWAARVQTKTSYPVIVDTYREDLTSLMAKAAFSVSLAGYNTTLEILSMGVPSILIPKFTDYNGEFSYSTEQAYRLMRLEKAGLSAIAMPNTVIHADAFGKRLVDEFYKQTDETHVRPRLNFDGVTNTLQAMGALGVFAPRHTPS